MKKNKVKVPSSLIVEAATLTPVYLSGCMAGAYEWYRRIGAFAGISRATFDAAMYEALKTVLN